MSAQSFLPNYPLFTDGGGVIAQSISDPASFWVKIRKINQAIGWSSGPRFEIFWEKKVKRIWRNERKVANFYHCLQELLVDKLVDRAKWPLDNGWCKNLPKCRFNHHRIFICLGGLEASVFTNICHKGVSFPLIGPKGGILTDWVSGCIPLRL